MELSAKANKSTEDIERLNEITSEIGQQDETLLTAKGKVDVEKVRAALDAANKTIKDGIQENYDKAMEAWNAMANQSEFSKQFYGEAKSTEEMRSALSDYYS